MSDWYGYDKDCPCPTSYSSSIETINLNGMCSATINQTYYHNGSGTLPAVGDECYSNSNQSTALVGGYYRTSSGGGILINNNTGTVTSLQTCISLTQFKVSTPQNGSFRMCQVTQPLSPIYYYHTGSGTYPVSGSDTVYIDAAGTTVLNGGSGTNWAYYPASSSASADGWFRILGPSGVVFQDFTCP